MQKTNFSNAKSLISLSVLSILLSACGGGGSNPPAPQGESPIANAGSDFIAGAASSVTLAGSGNDPDGSISNYAWAQISGATVNLSSANSATATFTAPAPSSTPLIFELTTTDNDGNTDTDTVEVQVKTETPYNYLISSIVQRALGEDGSYILECVERTFNDEGATSSETVTTPGADDECFSADDIVIEGRTYIFNEASYPENEGMREYIAGFCSYVTVFEYAPWEAEKVEYLMDCDDINSAYSTQHNVLELTPDGYFAEIYGYQDDDPSTQFFSWAQEYESDGITLKTGYSRWDSGEDATWYTSDDSYIEVSYVYDDNGVLIYEQGVIGLTGEVNNVTYYQYDENGMTQARQQYLAPGPDNDWFTLADNELGNYEVMIYHPRFPVAH